MVIFANTIFLPSFLKFSGLKLRPRLPLLHRPHPGSSATPTIFHTMNTFLSWLPTSLSVPLWLSRLALALQNSSKKGGSRRGKNARISPVLLVNPDHDQPQQYNVIYQKPRPKTQVKKAADSVAIGFSRSGSDRSFKKYTSRRAKLAVRSFKLRLTTIHEGTALN
ncbi:hypothetical protein OIU78_012992 [Salix suchowensis]|nr:hypothetical protein OIU78_012992 [Salix suchowensis]